MNLQMSDTLPTGAVIGILGGGQLGRMLAAAAARMGFRCHIYDPAANPPAADVAQIIADERALPPLPCQQF